MANPLCPKTERERDEALAENATLRASLERMREAMDNIRYRYFPADDEGRVQWARRTFEIARAALAETEQTGGDE